MGLIENENVQVARWARLRTCYAVTRDGDRVTVSRAIRHGQRVRHETLYDDRAAPDREAWQACARIIQGEVDGGRAWVVSALPAHLGILRKLSAPYPVVSKALKVFPSLLDIDIPFPLEQCDYAFLSPVRDEKGHVQATALAVRHEELDGFLADIEKLEVRPSILDHEGLALWTQAVVEQSPARADEPRVLVWLGRSRTVIAAGLGSRLTHVHTVRGGLGGDAGAGGDAHAWSMRVQRFMKSVSGMWDGADPRWIWAGPGAAQPEQVEELTALLFPDDPPPGGVLDQPEYLLERALACRAMQPGKAPFNFLTGNRTDRVYRAARQRRNLRTACFFAVCGLLLTALSLGFDTLLRQQDRKLQAMIDGQYLHIVGAPNLQRGQEILLAERALADIAEQNQPFISVFDPSLTTPVLALLRHSYQHDLFLAALEVDDRALRVEGSTADWDLCVAMTRLVESGMYEVDLKRTGEQGGRMAFTLTATKKNDAGTPVAAGQEPSS